MHMFWQKCHSQAILFPIYIYFCKIDHLKRKSEKAHSYIKIKNFFPHFKRNMEIYHKLRELT